LQRHAVDEFFLRYAEEHDHLQYEENKTQEEALAA
jgi:tRNA-dihydrouridine synthase B